MDYEFVFLQSSYKLQVCIFGFYQVIYKYKSKLTYKPLFGVCRNGFGNGSGDFPQNGFGTVSGYFQKPQNYLELFRTVPERFRIQSL